jgi:RHS repeat-associated protein
VGGAHWPPSVHGQERLVQRYAYEWDEVGRLVRARRWDMQNPTTIPPDDADVDAELSFTYDASDQRVRKTSGARHTLYVFASLELRGAEYEAGDYSQAEVPYLFANGVRLARVVQGDSTGVYLELGDHLGSTSVVLDRATGELVQRDKAYAYGAAESSYRPEKFGEFREDYRFTGKEDDVEVGLIYFGKRYYAPLLGRWISADPLAVHAPGEADLNLYAYVHGKVLVAVDPVGLDDCPEGASCQPEAPRTLVNEGEDMNFVTATANQSCAGGEAYCDGGGNVVDYTIRGEQKKIDEWVDAYQNNADTNKTHREQYAQLLDAEASAAGQSGDRFGVALSFEVEGGAGLWSPLVHPHEDVGVWTHREIGLALTDGGAFVFTTRTLSDPTSSEDSVSSAVDSDATVSGGSADLGACFQVIWDAKGFDGIGKQYDMDIGPIDLTIGQNDKGVTSFGVSVTKGPGSSFSSADAVTKRIPWTSATGLAPSLRQR